MAKKRRTWELMTWASLMNRLAVKQGRSVLVKRVWGLRPKGGPHRKYMLVLMKFDNDGLPF